MQRIVAPAAEGGQVKTCPPPPPPPPLLLLLLLLLPEVRLSKKCTEEPLKEWREMGRGKERVGGV